MLLPSNPISHSRLWKGQVHFLARHHRVVLYDGRGNGRSDAPAPGLTWDPDWRWGDCLTVMAATGTDTAVLGGLCGEGVWPSVQLAGAHPERVLGIVALAAGVAGLGPNHPFKAAALAEFDTHHEHPEGWQKYNRHHIRDHYADYLSFFFAELLPEPHSTRQREDAIRFALDTRPDVLLQAITPDPLTPADYAAACERVRCPMLVIHGDADNCQPLARSRRLAELTGAELVVVQGAGHITSARHPVLVNRLIDGFVRELPAVDRRAQPVQPRVSTWTAARRRVPRVLLVSSPIGLGHAWRDVAIARELRRQVPGLEVHWLAQAPVTRLLEACGETIHPASADLASEAAFVDAWGADHTLHAFQMLRHLDEVFCANFMVFHDLVRAEPYDAWIADEAWEVDYFLHENPELKTAPYVWLTDFVGVLPMASGGQPEADLAADWNAQMVEHVARNPALRDRSIFIGDPEDVVEAPLGPGLPGIREWTLPRFAFPGYITGFGPELIADRAALRAQLGWGPEEQICVVAAGGSAVGRPLLEKAMAAFAPAKAVVPGLRMVVVGGPRVDVGGITAADLETHGYVHELYRQLAVCDVAVSHGGLATTMELAAAGRPFLYFPLAEHFEQNVHVDHRLARCGAGTRMDYDATGPEQLAAAIVDGLGTPGGPPTVRSGAAARAAAIIAELLPR